MMNVYNGLHLRLATVALIFACNGCGGAQAADTPVPGPSLSDTPTCAGATCGDCTAESGCVWRISDGKCSADNTGCNATSCVSEPNACTMTK